MIYAIGSDVTVGFNIIFRSGKDNLMQLSTDLNKEVSIINNSYNTFTSRDSYRKSFRFVVK